MPSACFTLPLVVGSVGRERVLSSRPPSQRQPFQEAIAMCDQSISKRAHP